VYGEWGSAVVLGTYNLRSTADAFDALKRGDTNFGGIRPLAGDVPVKAQIDTAPPAREPTVIQPAPPVDQPPTTPTVAGPPIVEPPNTAPIEVHVTGVSLGIARWSAVDGNENVVDLVPTYVFHTSVNGSTSDIEVLALDPAAIDFAKPISPPVPGTKPGGVTREPGGVPVPESKGSSSGSAPSVPVNGTPTS
jgi:hypothetical protein